MRFNKTAITLGISAAILANTSMAENAVESKAAYSAAPETTTQIVIRLKDSAALERGFEVRSDYSKEANQISEQQQQVFQQILAIAPNAQLLGQARLLSNFITVQLDGDTDVINKITELNAVQSVVSQPLESRSVLSNKRTSVQAQTNAEESSEEVALMAPYNNSDTAGSGATVAIISTGIDYTLPIFGGSGVYGDDGDPETPPAAGSYMEALENGAVGPTIPAVEDDPATPDIDESADAIPGFDGFPTDVVVGGWDFQAENYGNDANPIDQNHQYEHWNGATYPTGMGTELASIVHQLAPGAGLYAYKVFDVSESYGSIRARWASRTQILQAMEHALDPNQDGDTSDHVDVVLLDSMGAAAFYNKYEQSGSGFILDQEMIQRASALGMTVVTNAGIGGHLNSNGEATAMNHRGWISWEGSAPAAVTVGSAVIADDGETIVPATWSPMGPVRGSRDLKPEVMSFAQDIPVAKISSGDDMAPTKGKRSDATVAAARIAAAIAVIKSAHPGLGPVELKALLSNTANHNIKEVDVETGEILEQAELLHIGHGVENIEAATSSPVAVWDNESNQPYVQFGFHEVADKKVINKSIMVRNFSDSVQTYTLGFNANGDKEAQSAISLNYPESVSVPANHSVLINVEMTIDGTMLPAWSMVSSEDYTSENYLQSELNGYFQLTSEGQPELNVGWMVQARPSSTINKNVVVQEFPLSLGWNADLGRSEWLNIGWAEQFYPTTFDESPQYFALASSFINESNTATTYEAYPVIVKADNPPKDKAKTFGHKIKAVAGGLYDEPMCEISGKKLSIAVNLWEPAHDAMANWTDKIGTPLFFYDMFSQDVLKETGADESFAGISQYDVAGGEAVLLGQPYVDIDENGQPATFYIDYNMEYVYLGPSRIKKSKLPVRITPNGTNVVSEVCLEELSHHDISDAVDDPSIPLMVPELDENGNPIAEMADCSAAGLTLEEMIEFGYWPAYSSYCTTSTGTFDAEGYATDENGERLYNMVENTERGVPGQNELLNYFDQNFGFHIETDRDAQSEKFAPIAQFNPTKHGFYSDPEEVCTNGWFGMVCEVVNIDRTVQVGFAKVNDDNPIETAEFSHIITLEPNEEAAIVALRAGTFGAEGADFMVISTDDNYAITAPSDYVDEDGTPMASVRTEQVFSVMENAEVGTVVGKIKLDKAGFFGMTSSTYSEFILSIVNALPGSPFTINQETLELVVANPEALDYENNAKFEVMVQASQDLRNASQAAMITVWIDNANDIAPEVTATVTSVTSVITNSSDAEVVIDIAAMFTDVEGDSLTFTVTGLPMGLTYANGLISGTTDVEGVHVLTVTASDGINETSTNLELVIEDETTSSGSFGGFLLAFAGLSFLRRRK
ncbi:S8 family serine peptidase [Thalassotalea nanhaiensis]|uniref:S8 family serine peptidase n=1 Tax=Thalassotalea nanhaiensis TaxID=3065648 RepID=A0ABY9TJB4_9GAMM|nr:S8 family serine peptidase [Colwelliaceae bacterium SQ345]